MRNLEDCKAEVFRRSEERIKERKRTRNRVLACCISLCLLLVAGGLYIRPLLEPVDEMGRKSEEDCAIPEREPGGVTDHVLLGSAAYTSVEITDRNGASEVSRNITDVTEVTKLRGLLEECFRVPAIKESAETTVGQAQDTIIDGILLKYGSGEETEDCRFVFRGTAGDEFVFCLYGNVLHDEEKDCTVTLSDRQLSEVKTLLEQAEGNGVEE